MKSFLSVLLVACMVLAGVVAFGAQAQLVNVQGASTPSAQVTLISAATGTTGAYTTNYAVFDYPMNNLACDFISGQSSGTSNVAFALQANQGSSTTLFDTAANFGLASFNLASVTTAAGSIATKSIFVGKPFRTIVATVTSPTTTQVITINCSATQ